MLILSLHSIHLCYRSESRETKLSLSVSTFQLLILVYCINATGNPYTQMIDISVFGFTLTFSLIRMIQALMHSCWFDEKKKEKTCLIVRAVFRWSHLNKQIEFKITRALCVLYLLPLFAVNIRLLFQTWKKNFIKIIKNSI